MLGIGLRIGDEFITFGEFEKNLKLNEFEEKHYIQFYKTRCMNMQSVVPHENELAGH